MLKGNIMSNNKDWIKSVISHKSTDAVPYNFAFSPPARIITEQYYNGSIETTLNFPIRMTGPKSIKPLYADPDIYGNTITDEFGVVWSTNRIDRGSPINHCLPEDNLDNYKFPDASDPYRFEDMGEWCEDNKQHYSIVWIGDLWERATFMRGMENLLLDLHLNPGFVHSLLRSLTDYILQTMNILFDRFDFDGIAVSDDYGTQNSMLMSPADWRKFIKPYLAEIYTYAKTHGRTVFHHSCGHFLPIIGDMIDMGLDILHPIQPEAMDILKLKQDFGHIITFCGGISTQELLPYGTPEEIRKEVKRLKVVMGSGGGYILEPGIIIQADIPLANIVAMLDEAI